MMNESPKKGELFKVIELNRNKHPTHQKVQTVIKTVLKEEFTTVSQLKYQRNLRQKL